MSRSCVGCHRDGGIAPFALTDYNSVRDHASEIALATAARAMPPMPVDNSGSCNTYANARWLSDTEIAMLGRWARAGAPAGSQAEARPLPDALPSLANPDALLDTGVSYTPSGSSGHDDYRCFVVSVPAPARDVRYLTAYEVLPGEPRVVHHVIVYQPADAAAEKAAHDLDDAAAGAGYPCFGGAGVQATPLAMWAPGAGAIQLPSGTGVALAARRDLIVQIHYNLEHGSLPDRTRVALAFANEPVIAAQYLPIADLGLRLAPGQESVGSMASMPLDLTKFTIYGAMPHMHTLGRTLRVDVEANGESRCLVDVDRWDFHWQNAWWYDTPKVIENATLASIRCGFDTRDKSDVVTWGENTSDEMCLSFFYLTTRDQPDPILLCNDKTNPLFGSCLDDVLAGCFAPDLSASCNLQEGTLSWSDGSRFVSSGSGAGLYSAGSTDPCIRIQLGPGSAVLSKGDQQLSYATDGDQATFDCPDGSSLRASSLQVSEFNRCRGLSCPD